MDYWFEDDPYHTPPNYMRPSMSSVVHPTEKIVLVEEGPLTINDGAWRPPALNADNPSDADTNAGSGDLLCIRHNMIKAHPDTGAPYSAANFPSYDHRGNVNFADGHAEYVSRRFAHDPRHLDPSHY